MPRVTANSIMPDEDDAAVARTALERVKRILSRHAAENRPATEPLELIVQEDGERVTVPRGAVELLARILAHMAAGQGVSIVPSHAELTTQQAADMLNVSRPFLIGLLDAGEIGYRRVGTHRRIIASSLLDYQRRDDAQGRESADDLGALTQEMGLD